MNTTRAIPWIAALAALVWAVPARGGTALLYSSYVGGSESDGGYAVAVDAAGNTYITSCTGSFDFPIRNAFQPYLAGASDAYLLKVNQDGSLAWSTYLGGFGSDCAQSVAVDAEGFPWISGRATAGPFEHGPDFPWRNPLPGTVQPQAGTDVRFVARFDPDGNLLFSTPFGGTGLFLLAAPDPRGGVWVAGETSSPDFPLTAGAQDRSLDGPSDAFVARILPGPSLAYASFLGGSGEERVWELETDASGGVLLSGRTTSPDFPLRRAIESQPKPDFAARLDPSGNIEWATYLETGGGRIPDLAADPAGNAFILADSFLGGERNAVVVKIDPQGQPTASAVIPVGSCPLDVIAVNDRQVVLSGYCTGVKLVQLDSAALRPADSSIFPGFAEPLNMVLDSRNILHITGVVEYCGLLATYRAFQPECGGDRWDGFVMRVLANRKPDCSAAFADPGILWPPNGKMVPVMVRGLTDPDGDPLRVSVEWFTQDEPRKEPGTMDAIVNNTPWVQLRADRLGSGDGKVYHLHVYASDPLGDRCHGVVTVCVPHDQHGTCGDDGELYY